MSLRKFLAVTALFTEMAALTGCETSKWIGPEAKTDLAGSSVRKQIFPGGPEQYVTHISAAKLKSGNQYSASGELIVDGSLSPNVGIDVENGKLVINGDVADGDSLNVTQLVASHVEDKPPCYQYGYDFASGEMEYSWKWHGCDVTVVDGLLYEDSQAAISVMGHASDKASLTSNGQVWVKDHKTNTNGAAFVTKPN